MRGRNTKTQASKRDSEEEEEVEYLDDQGKKNNSSKRLSSILDHLRNWVLSVSEVIIDALSLLHSFRLLSTLCILITTTTVCICVRTRRRNSQTVETSSQLREMLSGKHIQQHKFSSKTCRSTWRRWTRLFVPTTLLLLLLLLPLFIQRARWHGTHLCCVI